MAPLTVACQAPLYMEFFRQEYWSRLTFPLPGDLPDAGIKPAFPPLAGGFFTIELPGKPQLGAYTSKKSILVQIIKLASPLDEQIIKNWPNQIRRHSSSSGLKCSSSAQYLPKLTAMVLGLVGWLSALSSCCGAGISYNHGIASIPRKWGFAGMQWWGECNRDTTSCHTHS